MADGTRTDETFITVRVPKAIKKRLRIKAVQDEVTVQSLVVSAIETLLGKRPS